MKYTLREHFYAIRLRLLCRLGFHNVSCWGRTDHNKAGTRRPKGKPE